MGRRTYSCHVEESSRERVRTEHGLAVCVVVMVHTHCGGGRASEDRELSEV